MKETDVKYHQLKEQQLDYVLVYSDKDYDEAEKLVARLKKCGLEGRLYDDAHPFDWPLSRDMERISDLVERSTFKFFLASNNLVDDTEDSDFIAHKSEALMKSIYQRDQTVIPIWLVPKKDINRESSRALYGLMSLQGLNPNSKYFEPHVEKLNSMEMFKKMKEERREAQEKKLHEYMEKKAKEEQQQKEAEEEARKRREAMPKKAKTGSDSRPNGVTGGNGVINNIINIQGSEVNIGGGAVPTSAPGEQLLMSYHAPEEFWRSFENQGAVGGAVDQNDMRLEEMEHDGQSQQESMDSRNGPSSTLDNSTTDISSYEQINP